MVLPNEKFIEYARPLIEGEVKVAMEGGLPRYVELAKSRVEKATAPAGLSGRQSVVECYCAAAGCFQHVRIPGCAFSPSNHKPDCFKLRS